MPNDPIHQAQLGRGIPVPGRTRGSLDCGPRSWQMGADDRTNGRVRPGVRALRRRAGVTGPQATSTADAQRALDGLRVPGRTPLRYYRKSSAAAVRQAVRNGRPVHLGIDYGAWNDSQRRRTGDPRYRGGHSVLVARERRRGAGVEWLLFDPLDDGRRPGIERGGRWVLRRDLLAAATSFAGGSGRVHAGVIGGGHAR